MKQGNNYHRTWCKTCNDFKIHIWTSETELKCETCKSMYTPYTPSEIDKDKIEEQRKRYKSAKLNKLNNMTKLYGVNMLENLQTQFPDRPYFSECDAGQIQIDKRNKETKEQLRQKYNNEKVKYNENFAHLNRNDKCACGSNKKYKQCCQPYYQKLRISN